MSFLKNLLVSNVLLLTVVSVCFAEKIIVAVPDMTCDHCSKAVEDRLRQEKDISKIEIDIKTKAVTIFTVDSVKITDEKIKSLIKDSGFEAKTIEREG